jgi:hypothetical protein
MMKNKIERSAIIIVILLFMSGAFFNSIMDVLQFRYEKSIFKNNVNQQFFNPKISWRNKWKDGDPEKGEAYPGSSTVFVLFTDAWHLAQFFMFTCFEAAVIFLLYKLYRFKWYILALIFLGMKVVFGMTFELFFKYLLIAHYLK